MSTAQDRAREATRKLLVRWWVIEKAPKVDRHRMLADALAAHARGEVELVHGEAFQLMSSAVQIIEQLIPEQSARGVADVVLHGLRALAAEYRPETPLDRLKAAIASCPPLPRCEHGQALRDHGGEHLEPPCGCRYKGDSDAK